MGKGNVGEEKRGLGGPVGEGCGRGKWMGAEVEYQRVGWVVWRGGGVGETDEREPTSCEVRLTLSSLVFTLATALYSRGRRGIGRDNVIVHEVKEKGEEGYARMNSKRVYGRI